MSIAAQTPEGDPTEIDSSPLSSQPKMEQQIESPPQHITSLEESSPAPESYEQKPTEQQQHSQSATPSDSGTLTNSPPDSALVSPRTRPQHSGWEPTTINMAKCDYCDQRRRGTLYRCAQCQIAICKACCSKGILNHDSKHCLDPDSVSWDLHPAAGDKPGNKRVRKTATTATKSTPTTRARTRAKAARGGRVRRTAASRVKTAENEKSQDEEMTDPALLAYQGNEEDQQAGAVLAGLSQLPSSITRAKADYGQAASPPETNEPVTAYYQSGLQAPKPQRPLTRQLAAMTAQAKTKTVPSSTKVTEGTQQDQPRQPTAFRTILPRPVQPQFDPFQHQQQQVSAHHQQFASGQHPQMHSYPNPQPMGYRAPPYRSQEYDMAMQLERNRQQAYQHRYGYAPTPVESLHQKRPVPQDRSMSDCNIDPRLSGGSSQPHQQQLHARASVTLPSLRNYEQCPPQYQYQQQQNQPQHQPQYYPAPPALQHQPEQQVEQQPVPEPLIHRIGNQLEADALATHEENPTQPMDECLRIELNRVWTRRNARTSLLREATQENPNVAEDVGNAFRTLLGAAYYASIRLNLDVQNASRLWIVETEKQLVADGLMEPVRPSWQWGNPK